MPPGSFTATSSPVAKLRISPPVAGFVISSTIKLLSRTLHWRVDDPAGMLRRPMPRDPVIWVCWHNRVLLAPVFHRDFFGRQPGAALTSASRDGEVLAQTCAYFDVKTARGSSSRRGAAALRECLRFLQSGHDLCITPDGPRGPRYRLSPGVVTLAQLSGAPVMLVHFQPSSAWQLNTWDRFMIPKPFSQMNVRLDPPRVIPRTSTLEEFEAQRAALEKALLAGVHDD